jgi:hypothetical protein
MLTSTLWSWHPGASGGEDDTDGVGDPAGADSPAESLADGVSEATVEPVPRAASLGEAVAKSDADGLSLGDSLTVAVGEGDDVSSAYAMGAASSAIGAMAAVAAAAAMARRIFMGTSGIGLGRRCGSWFR